MWRERGAKEMATPPHVLVLRLLTVSVTGCLRQRRLLQPHIKSHSRFVLPLFQNEAECDVRLIVKFWNLENVFSRVWEFTRWLQFGIWVLHHSMLLHAVICVIVYKKYVLAQGHSTAYLFALVRFALFFFWGFLFASAFCLIVSWYSLVCTYFC